jgi:hypothetical protein
MATRQFIQHSRTWYYDSSRGDWTEEFYLTSADFDGTAEVAVRWYGNVSGLKHSPKVEAFNDSWRFLFDECAGFLRPLHDMLLLPETFAALLVSEGWEDVTPVTSPYAEAP